MSFLNVEIGTVIPIKGGIIGDVLVQGKEQYLHSKFDSSNKKTLFLIFLICIFRFWVKGADKHYHHNMQPGENTLETLLARRLMNVYSSLKQASGVSVHDDGARKVVDEYLKDYVKFMTTKDSHNDVFVATSHRMFFDNWVGVITSFTNYKI